RKRRQGAIVPVVHVDGAGPPADRKRRDDKEIAFYVAPDEFGLAGSYVGRRDGRLEKPYPSGTVAVFRQNVGAKVDVGMVRAIDVLHLVSRRVRVLDVALGL